MLLGPPDPFLSPHGLTYHRIFRQTGMWLIQLTGVSISEQPLSDACNTDAGHACVALIDTGTSFIGIPARLYTDAVTAITSHRSDCVAHFTSLLVTCASPSLDSLPPLTLTLSSTHSYTLDPADYMVDRTLGLMPLHTHTQSQSSVDLFILGDTFIRTFYTVFDAEEGRVGMGNGKNVREAGGTGVGTGLRWKVGWAIFGVLMTLCLLALCCGGCMRMRRSPMAAQAPLGSASALV